MQKIVTEEMILYRPEAPIRMLCCLPGEDTSELRLPDGVALMQPKVDWNRDLSPWPAKSVVRHGEDFAGGAEAYLRRLIALLPEAERLLGAEHPTRILAGYSLAGLFAYWAIWQTGAFDLYASVSGSLWYDNLLDTLCEPPKLLPRRVYFSLGEREPLAKNPRFAAVGDCTRIAEARMRDWGVDTVLEWNPGGHGTDAPQRIARALDWLCGRE